jgi:hypothetical protein
MKKFLLILVVVLLMIVALATWWMARQRELEERYEDAVAAWIDSGGVMDLAELEPDPMSDDQNAAVLYRRAGTMLEDLSADELELLSEPLSSPELATVVDQHAETIELIREAAARPASAWGTDVYTNPNFAAVDLGYLAKLRSFARLLAADAVIQADRDDDENAAADIAALLRMSTHAASEPVVISWLVSAAIQSLALEQMEGLFASQGPPDERVANAIDAIDVDALFQRALLGETAATLRFMEDPGAAMSSGAFSGGTLSLAERIGYLTTMTNWLAETYDTATALDAPVTMSSAQSRTAGRMLQSLRPAMSQFAIGATQIAIARTALELRAYRDEHGSYPDTWDMPVDRTTGQPLNYERTDTGFRIFSDSSHEVLDWQWQ